MAQNQLQLRCPQRRTSALESCTCSLQSLFIRVSEPIFWTALSVVLAQCHVCNYKLNQVSRVYELCADNGCFKKDSIGDMGDTIESITHYIDHTK